MFLVFVLTMTLHRHLVSKKYFVLRKQDYQMNVRHQTHNSQVLEEIYVPKLCILQEFVALYYH